MFDLNQIQDLHWARCAQFINHMADAIIPVPIYDPQYQQFSIKCEEDYHN